MTHALAATIAFALGFAACRWHMRHASYQIAEAERETRIAKRQKAFWKRQDNKAFVDPIGYTLERNRKLVKLGAELFAEPTR